MAHPLFDRRDMTAERNRAAVPHEGGSWAHLDDILAALLAEATETRRIQEQIFEQRRAEVADLCVTDREPAQMVMADFPVPRAKRMIVRRTGEGGTYTIVANTPLLVVAANEARLGGLIVNGGANPVTLVLTADLVGGSGQPLSGGVPQLVLPTNTSWNFKLGDLLWCGNVLAVSAVGTTVSIAEV